MFEFHNDYVTKIAPGFATLASSTSCENEATVSEDGRILTFQFHSEYTYGYIEEFEVKIRQFYKQDLYKTNYVLRK